MIGMGGFRKLGVPLCNPYNQGFSLSILKSILGPPILGKYNIVLAAAPTPRPGCTALPVANSSEELCRCLLNRNLPISFWIVFEVPYALITGGI